MKLNSQFIFIPHFYFYIAFLQMRFLGFFPLILSGHHQLILLPLTQTFCIFLYHQILISMIKKIKKSCVHRVLSHLKFSKLLLQKPLI